MYMHTYTHKYIRNYIHTCSKQITRASLRREVCILCIDGGLNFLASASWNNPAQIPREHKLLVRFTATARVFYKSTTLCHSLSLSPLPSSPQNGAEFCSDPVKWPGLRLEELSYIELMSE